MRILSTIVLLLASLTLNSSITQGVEPAAKHVVLISVDGLPAYLIDDPQASLPNIRGVARRGSAAKGMRVSNPSVTWPNHTTLITGVPPAKHGVLFNGVLERPGPGLPVKVDPRRDFADLVAARTIYHAAKAAGMGTAAINWPCTRNDAAFGDNFPDVPEMLKHTTPKLIDEMLAEGILTAETKDGFDKLNSTVRDRIWTDATCHVIRKRKPGLVALHVLNVDAVHHRYGPKTPAGYTAVAYADACVGRVLAAIDEAGLRDRTAVFVVSDHGFMAIPRTLQPNVVLRKEGLLKVEKDQVTEARIQVIPEGGIGMVYITVPDNLPRDRRKVRDLFEKQEGIAGILEPDEFSKYGLPRPDDNRRMADLILVAKDGYGFGATVTGDDFVVDSATTTGTHGFLSTNPLMNATFIAAGAGVKPGVALEVIDNFDVAPTIARLLGLTLEQTEGKPLDAILAK